MNLTAEEVLNHFRDQKFGKALELLVRDLEKQHIFSPQCRGHKGLYEHEEQTRAKVISILNGTSNVNTVYGDYFYDNSEFRSIGVFEFSISFISQYLKIRNRLILPKETIPFLGVSIWLGSDTINIKDIEDLSRIRMGHDTLRVNWPKELEGFPVKYSFSTETTSTPDCKQWRFIRSQ